MKILYIDTETTGLYPQKHSIIKLAGAVEIDGEIVEEFDFKMRPLPGALVDPTALQINGVTLDQMALWPEPRTAYASFIDVMARYVKKYNKDDKFTPCGYAARFDCEFIQHWFRLCGDNYWGSWQNWRIIDIMSVVYWLRYMGVVPDLKNYKLTTVCEYFNVPLPNAHDALGDIRATILLKKKIEQAVYELQERIGV